jgi:hypothetical protein
MDASFRFPDASMAGQQSVVVQVMLPGFAQLHRPSPKGKETGL